MASFRSRARTRPGSRPLIRTATAACLLALLATACIEVKMDFVVREDGAGSAEVSMRLDGAVLELAMLSEGGDPEQYCHQLADEPDANDPMGFGLDTVDSSTEAVIDDGDCLVTSTVMWTAEESDEVLDALMADDGPSFRRLDDGGWRFDLETAELSEDMSDDELSEAAALGFDFPTFALSVTLPGDIVEHNADTVRGSTYTWEFDTADMREFPDRIYLETAPGGGGLGPEAIGAIVAGIVLVLAALVTLRRHQEAKAAAAKTRDVETGADSAGEAALDGDTPDEGGNDTPEAESDGSTGTTDR